jgi:hypothetical protein
MNQLENQNHWNEELSKEFIDYGRNFVPDRQYQIETIVQRLLPPAGQVGYLRCAFEKGSWWRPSWQGILMPG